MLPAARLAVRPGVILGGESHPALAEVTLRLAFDDMACRRLFCGTDSLSAAYRKPEAAGGPRQSASLRCASTTAACRRATPWAWRA
jgi:hypothetical protein